jgi:phosphatidylglycerol---prolipoprotein diacylglyceryl transferase
MWDLFGQHLAGMFAALDFPNIRPEIFTIPRFDLLGLSLGPFSLRWYALAWIAGLILGWRYMVRLIRTDGNWGKGKKAPVTVLQADDFLFWATLAVILGGRIGYVLFYMLPSESERAMLSVDPGRVFRIWEGGLSFHGGLLGMALTIVLCARAYKVPLLSLGDLVACAAPIGLFFGRIANFINAELYGRAADVPWAVRFPIKDASGAVVQVTEPRHPSQLYEAVLEGLVLFFILRHLTLQRGVLEKPGFAAGVFLVGYGVFRGFVELLREPDSQMPEALRGYVTMGMLLCLPMIALGVWLIRRAKLA